MAGKVGKVLGEFKRGTLHSGSKRGPVVTSPAQAKAIALSEARKAGEKVKPPPKKKKSYLFGGVVPQTGLAMLHRGETVVPAPSRGAAYDFRKQRGRRAPLRMTKA